MKLRFKLLAVCVLMGIAAPAAAFADNDSITAPNAEELSVIVTMRYASTDQYLNDLYELFGDWELADYALRYGPTYVRRLQLRGQEMTPPEKPVIKRTAPAPKPAPAPKQPKTITYTVKSGDTLSGIARKYHVKVSDLKKWNHLKNDIIKIDQKLKIYQ